MKTYIALLRGINVSGQKLIKMADLRLLMEQEGFKQVKTYVQSGNLIFNYAKNDPTVIENDIKKLIRKKYGFDVNVIVKQPAELVELLEKNPFKADPDKAIERMYFTLLAETPKKERVDLFNEISNPPEEFVIDGRNIYGYSPLGFSRAKLNNNFYENKLKVSATTRNWKTINNLVEIVKTDFS